MFWMREIFSVVKRSFLRWIIQYVPWKVINLKISLFIFVTEFFIDWIIFYSFGFISRASEVIFSGNFMFIYFKKPRSSFNF